MRKKIAVIGSGIAGLSAACDLQRAGHDVTVYVSSDFVGGRMADQIVNGICTHSGASIIFSFNLNTKVTRVFRTPTPAHRTPRSLEISFAMFRPLAQVPDLRDLVSIGAPCEA